MLSSSAQWALGLDSSPTNDFTSMSAYANSQPRHLPAYISGSELSAPITQQSPISSPTRPQITATLPMLNPSTKRIREDDLLDLGPDGTPELTVNGCMNPLEEYNNYTYLDPSASFDPTALTTRSSSNEQATGDEVDEEGFDFLDESEAGPMEEGEQVLRLGNRRPSSIHSTSNTTTAAAAGARKRKTNNSAAHQKLLAEASPDEDGKASGRKKIQIEFIQDKSRRHITFSKRKAGIMKKVCFFPL